MVSYSPQGAVYYSGGSRYDQTYPVVFDFTGGVLDPRIKITSLQGTYFDSSGLLVQAQQNQPRFDYGLGGTSLLGLLCEQSSVNEALRSRDLTNATWVKSGGGGTSAALDQVGIDGVTNSACSLTASGANGTCMQAITSTSSLRYFSLYIKRLVGTGNIDLTLDNGTGWTTVTTTSSWTRVSISQTVTNPTIGIRIVTSGDKVAIDCVQEEKLYLTSPIITTTSTITRSSDVPTATGFDFYPWFNPFEGTMYVEYSIPNPVNNATRVAASINAGSSQNAYEMYVDEGSGLRKFQVITNNVSQAFLGAGGVSVNTICKQAGSYKLNQVDAAIDGVASSQDTSAVMPQVMTGLYIGRRFAGSGLNGHVRKFKYWNYATPSGLAGLTS